MRHFIVSRSSIDEGKTMDRIRLRKVDDVTAGAYPVNMGIETRQPKAL